MKNEYDFSKGKRAAVVSSSGKTRITIMLDDDVLEAFRKQAAQRGLGYQTLINDALRQHIAGDSAPVTVKKLREVLREVLHPA
jgi:uncharacterized protein (DUF4415 family)